MRSQSANDSSSSSGASRDAEIRPTLSQEPDMFSVSGESSNLHNLKALTDLRRSFTTKLKIGNGINSINTLDKKGVNKLAVSVSSLRDSKNGGLSKSSNMNGFAAIDPLHDRFGESRPPRGSAESIEDRLAKRRRHRAEVYAINTYLRRLEEERFETFKRERSEKGCGVEDYSWCSDDSSVLPSPRYRTEAEKRRGGEVGVSGSKRMQRTSHAIGNSEGGGYGVGSV